MPPQPLYHAQGVQPAYELRFTWTGWPLHSPLPAPSCILDDIRPLWETDGLRLLERSWSEEKVQLLFSTKPDVAPVLLAQRAKGRLQHALRTAAPSFSGFRRKVSVSSVGHNRRADVEAYVASQVDASSFDDPLFRTLLREFTVDHGEDLALPIESSHGRYTYSLHLVLVTAERYRVVDRAKLATLRDVSLKIATKKSYTISRLAVMPDHLHIALRGNIEHSLEEIVLSFQNNLAYALGQIKVWTDTYYVGTFGEYDMQAIRRNVAP